MEYNFDFFFSVLLVHAAVVLSVGALGPQFSYKMMNSPSDEDAVDMVVFWSHVNNGTKRYTAPTVSFAEYAKGCDARYQINRVGFTANTLSIIFSVVLTVCIAPLFSKYVRNWINIHSFVRLGLVVFTFVMTVVAWACSYALLSSTLCGTSPSQSTPHNHKLEWGFTFLCYGSSSLFLCTAMDVWRVTRGAGMFVNTDHLLDSYVSRHRQFLLQTLNFSKFKDFQRESNGGDEEAGLDAVVRAAIKEYSEAVTQLLQRKAEVLHSPITSQPQMIANTKPFTLSPEALFVQHVHRLMPINYRDEVIRATTPPPFGMSPIADIDGLHAMVIRQLSTATKMVHYGMTAPLRKAMIVEYHKFLLLAREQKERISSRNDDGIIYSSSSITNIHKDVQAFIVPTMTVDVVWHAHMSMDPKHYLRYAKDTCGYVLNHNDDMSEETLESQRVATKLMWESKFTGETYPSNGKVLIKPYKGPTTATTATRTDAEKKEIRDHHTLASNYGVQGAYCALPMVLVSTCSGVGGCGGDASQSTQCPATCGTCGMIGAIVGEEGVCVGGGGGRDIGVVCGGGASCGAMWANDADLDVGSMFEDGVVVDFGLDMIAAVDHHDVSAVTSICEFVLGARGALSD